MRSVAIAMLFALALLVVPSSGCSWLSSGTPLANATSGTLDCVKVGATDAFQAAAPALLNDILKWATGGAFTWADVVAAFGGLEAIIKDGIVTATCIYDAIAAAVEQSTAGTTQPAAIAILGRTLKIDDAVRVARFTRTYMAMRGLRVSKRMAIRAAVVTP